MPVKKNSRRRGGRQASVQKGMEVEAINVVALEVEEQPRSEPRQVPPLEEPCDGRQPSEGDEDSQHPSEEDEDNTHPGQENEDYGDVYKQTVGQADAQRRYSTLEDNRFSKSLISQSNAYVREKLFRLLKFPDDHQIYMFLPEIRATLLTGPHANDDHSRNLFDLVVFPEMVRTYKNSIRHRRRSVNQAMERIAVGKLCFSLYVFA
jgi:hypothetical protein